MGTRKLPPYGRRVAAALSEPASWRNYIGTSADGSGVTLWIAIGSEAWEWAAERREHRHLVVAIPPDVDPKAFNWKFMAGHDPIMLCGAGEVDAEHAKAAATALLRDGVQHVTYLPNDGSLWTGYAPKGRLSLAVSPVQGPYGHRGTPPTHRSGRIPVCTVQG